MFLVLPSMSILNPVVRFFLDNLRKPKKTDPAFEKNDGSIGCGCQNLFGGIPCWWVGEFTTHFRTYSSGEWDVRWGYPILTHGQTAPVLSMSCALGSPLALKKNESPRGLVACGLAGVRERLVRITDCS